MLQRSDRGYRGYWTGVDAAAEGVVLLTGIIGVLVAIVVMKLAWPR
jgi:hypothetical protein